PRHLRCSRTVVWNVSDSDRPTSARPLQNGVASVRRSDFDLIGNWRLTVITRQAHAARIDNHPPISQSHNSRDVGVPAEDERGVNATSLTLDGFNWARAHGAFGINIVKPECCIVSRRRMAKIDIAMINKSWRQTGHPIEVLAYVDAEGAVRPSPIEAIEAEA